ncbi:MAG: alpha/beta hydrolase [Rhizobiales bacterium]|nr:alpha/beta hydrolase [Hyphomicrobiales bacterium]OJY06119.1 MAG: alpha/beta hydrolase [Rhizobiales bacterium 63-22]
MTFETVHHLSLPGGIALPYRRALAERPRAVVQICHGLAEHSARYGRFAAALAEAGYHVYAQDHRGHGVNIGARMPKGMFAKKDGWRAAIGDVAALNHTVRAAHPGLPVVLFGHSMGGLIALDTVLDHPETADAAAIWNANFDGGSASLAAFALLYAERMLKGSDVPSTLLPKLTFRAWGRSIPSHSTLFDWLSRDRQEVDAYIADPLCGFDPSVSLWIDVFRLIRYGAADRHFGNVSKTLPIQLLGGAEDPATAKGEAVRRLETRLSRMGFKNVACTILPETRHESLNEINREQATQIFLDWLGSALPST